MRFVVLMAVKIIKICMYSYRLLPSFCKNLMLPSSFVDQMIYICVKRSVGTRLLAIQWKPLTWKGTIFRVGARKKKRGGNMEAAEEEVGGWEKGRNVSEWRKN